MCSFTVPLGCLKLRRPVLGNTEFQFSIHSFNKFFRVLDILKTCKSVTNPQKALLPSMGLIGTICSKSSKCFLGQAVLGTSWPDL
jgi:hypothetical protein